MKPQRRKAEEFRALHHGEHILVLPNCWDVPSARIFEDAGFRAVATTSAGVSYTAGYVDGQMIPRDAWLVELGDTHHLFWLRDGTLHDADLDAISALVGAAAADGEPPPLPDRVIERGARRLAALIL